MDTHIHTQQVSRQSLDRVGWLIDGGGGDGFGGNIEYRMTSEVATFSDNDDSHGSHDDDANDKDRRDDKP